MNISLVPSLKIGFTVFSMLLILLAAPLTAHACACCAESGTWFRETERTDHAVDVIVKSVGNKLGATATLTGSSFRGGNYSDVKGISPAAETYTLKFTRPPGGANLK